MPCPSRFEARVLVVIQWEMIVAESGHTMKVVESDLLLDLAWSKHLDWTILYCRFLRCPWHIPCALAFHSEAGPVKGGTESHPLGEWVARGDAAHSLQS
eukprot:68281-Amphidinium_carterae.1